MSTVDGLVFDSGIPPTIEQEHIIGKLQIESDTANTVAHQKNMFVRVVLEAIKDALPFWMGYLAVIQQGTKFVQGLGQKFQRLNPLREDDGFASALGYFSHIGLQTFELGALFGQRIEIADLFEPQDQLKNVLYR